MWTISGILQCCFCICVCIYHISGILYSVYVTQQSCGRNKHTVKYLCVDWVHRLAIYIVAVHLTHYCTEDMYSTCTVHKALSPGNIWLHVQSASYINVECQFQQSGVSSSPNSLQMNKTVHNGHSRWCMRPVVRIVCDLLLTNCVQMSANGQSVLLGL